MKKILCILAAFGLSLVFAACGGTQNGGTAANPKLGFSNTRDAYAYSALSVGSILGSLSSGGAAPLAAFSPEAIKLSDKTSNTPAITDEDIERINSYLALAENLLSNGQITAVETPSDLAPYEIKLTVSCADLLGEKISYILYYNQVPIVDSDDDTEQDDHEEDDTEEEDAEGLEDLSADAAPLSPDEEQEYSIDGVMIVGETTYTISGDIEREEGESEIKFRAEIDSQNYITVKHEIEEDETFFVYEVYEQGNLTVKNRVQSKIEEEQTFVKMEVSGAGKFVSLKFKEQFEDGVHQIKVDYTENENRISFKIKITENELEEEIYQYILHDKTVNLNRFSPHKNGK